MADLLQIILLLITVDFPFFTCGQSMKIEGQSFWGEPRSLLSEQWTQTIFDPGTLIRLLAGLDKLNKLSLIWRRGFKKLPLILLSAGHSMDPLNVGEHRGFKFYRQSIPSQREIINKIPPSRSLYPGDEHLPSEMQHASNFFWHKLQPLESSAYIIPGIVNTAFITVPR